MKSVFTEALACVVGALEHEAGGRRDLLPARSAVGEASSSRPDARSRQRHALGRPPRDGDGRVRDRTRRLARPPDLLRDRACPGQLQRGCRRQSGRVRPAPHSSRSCASTSSSGPTGDPGRPRWPHERDPSPARYDRDHRPPGGSRVGVASSGERTSRPRTRARRRVAVSQSPLRRRALSTRTGGAPDRCWTRDCNLPHAHRGSRRVGRRGLEAVG
jgi:hypothetical protein